MIFLWFYGCADKDGSADTDDTQYGSADKDDTQYGSVTKTSSTSVNVVGVVILLVPSILYISISTQHQHHHSAPQWHHRTLLQADEEIIDPGDWKFIIGYILGCLSAVIYFFALPPQIIKNVSCRRYIPY